jgi:hypothetical protein
MTASIADIAGIIQGVGSLAAVGAAVWIYARQYQDRRADDENETRAFVEAIREEVLAAWDGYCIEVHPLLQALPVGQHFDLVYPVLTETFTIYNNGASMVGKINDVQLRSIVVKTYALARSLIYSFQLNNSMLTEYKQLLLLYRQPDRDAVLAAHAHNLRNYAVKLKERDQWIEQAVTELLARTAEWLASPPPR